MNRPQAIGRAKTIVLVALVIVSVLLSCVLSFGGWQNTPDTGISAMPSLPAATNPQLSDVVRPNRVILTRTNPQAVSIAVPGTTDYNAALALLGSAHVFDMGLVAQLPNATIHRIEFDYGAEISQADLTRWLPSPFDAMAFSSAGVAVYLFPTNDRGVLLGMRTANGLYLGQTDLTSIEVMTLVNHAVNTSPWVEWNASGSYLPATKQTLPTWTAHVSDANLLPTVHSFFVNPQILTQIRENQSTILWTDGSRAVQYEQSSDTLTYQDPNSPGETQMQMPLDYAVDFMRSHGGGPAGLLAFADTASSADVTYTFVQYLDGFPIWNANSNYQIQVLGNHVAEYRRPLWTLTNLIQLNDQPVLTPQALTAALEKFMTPKAVHNTSIQLAYLMTPQPGSGSVLIQPVYLIMTNGSLGWLIDAHNGDVIPGGDVS